MSIAEQVRELVYKKAPVEALSLIKEKSPDDVKEVADKIFDDPTVITGIDEEWSDLLYLIYYSYFSYITSDLVDSQSLTENTVSSLNAAKFSRKMNFPELEYIFLFNAAQALNHMDMNDRAIKCYMEAEQTLDKIEGDTTAEKASILNNIGAMLIENKEIEKAQDYLEKALEMRRELSQKDNSHLPELAETLSNIAALYGDKRDYENAEKLYQESISIFRDLAKDNLFHKANLASTLNNYSIIKRRLERFDAAEENIKEALSIFKELKEINAGFEGMYAETLNRLGVLYNETGRSDEAEKYFKEWKSLVLRLDREKAEEKMKGSEK